VFLPGNKLDSRSGMLARSRRSAGFMVVADATHTAPAVCEDSAKVRCFFEDAHMKGRRGRALQSAAISPGPPERRDDVSVPQRA